MNIVTISNGLAVTTSEIISANTGTQHKNVLELVKQYQSQLEEFGLVAFETRPRPKGQHGGGDIEIAILNEPQSTFVLTLMRNSEIVVKFKLALVKAFYDLAKRPAIPAVKDARTQALIESLVRLDAVEQEQQRQATELSLLQENVAVIEARTQPENKHFTVMGYANLLGRKIDGKTAAKLGKQCANESRSQGLPIGDVSDSRYGSVHSYHESILRPVMLLAYGVSRAAVH